MAISLLFFSSADISIPLLKQLLSDERFEVKAVFCQPDKPAGRNLELKAPVPKVLAEERGIPVHQPVKLKDADELLELYDVDFLLTFAYGQIMPQSWLNLAKIAPLNVHTSLLPKYRGASPIQSAILNGDAVSGYSLMKMVKAMDAGPVSHQVTTVINEETSAGELHDTLAQLAAENVPDQIIEMGESPVFLEQDESKISFCGKISRDDGRLDFSGSAKSNYRKFKAYSPWPGVWTSYEGKRLKLHSIRISNEMLPQGQVQEIEGRIIIGCESGSLELIEVQPEGKRRMPAKDFALGQSAFVSAKLPS